MSNSNFSTNMGYSRSISTGSSSGRTSGPSPSAGSWNFDTNLEDYQRTNNVTTRESLSAEDGSIELDMFITGGEVGTVGTAEITDSLGLELADLDDDSWLNKALELAGKVGATVAVAANSMVSGILDVGEGLLDGVVWAGATVASWFGVDTTAAKEFIARDLVDEANEEFYENTELGRALNENSYIKYDSEAAQNIRAGSEIVTNFALATALTFATGGTAAPFAVGMTLGLGETAENTYQTKGTDANIIDELKIFGSGILTGLSWIGKGKLGLGHVTIAEKCMSRGWKVVGKEIIMDVLNPRNLYENLKRILTTSAGRGIYINATFLTAEDIIPFITGEKEFDFMELCKLVGAFGYNVIKNAFFDIVTGYISDYGGDIPSTSPSADTDATPNQNTPPDENTNQVQTTTKNPDQDDSITKPLTFKEWLELFVNSPQYQNPEDAAASLMEGAATGLLSKSIESGVTKADIYDFFSNSGQNIQTQGITKIDGLSADSIITKISDFSSTGADVITSIPNNT